MGAYGCDFECTLALLLAAHVTQIRHARTRDKVTALRRLQGSATAKVIDEREQRWRGNHFAASPRGFRAARIWTNERGVHALRSHCCGQRAGCGRKRAIESEFTERDDVFERINGQRADRRHHRHRDGQIVVRALLRQIGGCEIDDQTARGNGQSD